MRLASALLFLLLLTKTARANYNFDANCKAAYLAAWSLRPAEAGKYLSLESKKSPSNLIPEYVASLGDFVAVFANEEPAAYQKFKTDEDAHLDALDRDKNGPWYLYCKAEIYLQSAVLKLKFAENLGAAYDFNKAYHNLTECNDDYPGFLPAQKDLLLLKAMVGSVPSNYRWMLKILGFSGDLKTSMAKYEVLMAKMDKSKDYIAFERESRIIYAYLDYFMMNRPDEAWKQIDMVTKDYATNPLAAFVRANIAMHLKKNDIAIETLQPNVTTPPAIPYLDYMIGIAKLQRGDRNAGFYLGRYLKEYKGQHYVKDAWLKLGWAFFLLGNMQNYQGAMLMVPDNGTATLEEDKNALKEAAHSKYLVGNILRARLYFDGGYFGKAKEEIQKVKPTDLSNDYQRAEYYYRYARILDALGEDKQAMDYYMIVMGKYISFESENTYFAPASSLYCGMIWEREKDLAKAAAFYHKCLDYKNYVYKDSFDQKAYAGLKRVE